jgi:aspartate carbamoyltransferase regulatory subunit
MEQKKQLQVSAIENGTVIDHIPAKSLFKVISILGLDKIECPITFGTNLESKRLGCKAIIKISDVFFEDEDINKIALVAPAAKLNIIRNYNVVEKKVLGVPSEIKGIVKCINPKCITNHEAIVTKFSVISRDEVTLKCKYCEKVMDQEHIEII